MVRKQFVVVGLGRFGATLAVTLCANGGEVLAIDIDGERVELLRDNVTHCVEANGMNREALVQLGVRDFDVAVVAIDGDLRASCMTTMLMKELGVKYVASCAQDEVHGRMLTKLGADKVIFPERDMGKRVAHNLMAGNILDFIELSPDYSMVEIQVPQEWNGKTLAQLDLRKRLGINVIAIRRDGHVDASPMPGTLLSSSDRMLVMAGHDIIKKLGQA